MTTHQAIAKLHADLARTIASLDQLRASVALYALAADAPERNAAPVTKDTVSQFLRAQCRPTAKGYVRTPVLWHAYCLWSKANGLKRLKRAQFERKVMAAGYPYCRSRRINGKQARTYEGLALRTRGGETLQ